MLTALLSLAVLGQDGWDGFPVFVWRHRHRGEELPAERKAKGGEEIDPESPLLPLAGLFTAAEIAPAAGTPRVHTHSAVLTLFRKAPTEPADGR